MRDDTVAPGRAGDVLTDEASEQALSGKSGLYDVRGRKQEGKLLALLRGKSLRAGGQIIQSKSIVETA